MPDDAPIAIGESGLVLGLGTCLARMTKDGTLAVADDRERMLALLSVADRRPISPDILHHVEAAAGHWQLGDRALANLRLIFAGLSKLDDPIDAWRLRAAEYLLDEGMSPRELMKELGLDTSALDFGKYDPNQLRVPAGSGRESGRWTEDSDAANTPQALTHSNVILAADQTTAGGVVYDDKIQRQMKSRGFTPEQIDEAVRSGTRIDAINKATGAPAVRYVNPTTGQSVVIDSTTNQAIHVGGPGYGYGPGAGDVPGATMRPPPLAPATSVPIEEPIVIPDVILPP